MKMQSDALKVQVRLNESELSLRRAENARRLAAKNLCQVIGHPFDAEIEVELELSRAWDMLDEARLEEELSAQSLEQAQENRTLSRKQYDAGMESLSDYLETELLWRQAFASKVESRCQTYLAYVQFLKASGEMEL